MADHPNGSTIYVIDEKAEAEAMRRTGFVRYHLNRVIDENIQFIIEPLMEVITAAEELAAIQMPEGDRKAHYINILDVISILADLPERVLRIKS